MSCSLAHRRIAETADNVLSHAEAPRGIVGSVSCRASGLLLGAGHEVAGMMRQDGIHGVNPGVQHTGDRSLSLSSHLFSRHRPMTSTTAPSANVMEHRSYDDSGTQERISGIQVVVTNALFESLAGGNACDVRAGHDSIPSSGLSGSTAASLPELSHIESNASMEAVKGAVVECDAKAVSKGDHLGGSSCEARVYQLD
ncbi:hypothetical protein BKA70DRAFT_1439377 [Coprinopsis sp. MPI-PUGE-AT-0042]|nr:hypothetical protein BKA70DRAFT_1439377 [Coprinopsis sp. MPI-PUGE-AT-0042]